MMELPHITKSAYGAARNELIMGQAMGVAGPDELGAKLARVFAAAPQDNNAAVVERARRAAQQQLEIPTHKQPKQAGKPMPTMRIVRVFIADNNANIPLDKRVIYKSEEQLTDLTDQELFFEANPAALLATHNELRTKTIDKAMTAARGKEVFLEPARIRDLQMVVVDVAAF